MIPDDAAALVYMSSDAAWPGSNYQIEAFAASTRAWHYRLPTTPPYKRNARRYGR